KNLRMVSVEAESGFVFLLAAQAIEAFDGRAAVGAVDPVAGGPPLELGGLGRFGQRFACAEQRVDVHAVLDFGGGHGLLLDVFGDGERKDSSPPAWIPRPGTGKEQHLYT